jgi:nicotinamidase-related amidase
MSEVIYLKALINPAVAPCLVLVDLQREYVTKPRLMAVPGAAGALDHCRVALSHARARGFPVAHCRQISKSPFFNRSSKFSAWIEGFEPTAAEMVFDHEKPSCYSNKQFSTIMEDCGGHFVIAGFAGETACLSTIVDAYHRGHQVTYLSDASASHALGNLTEQTVQQSVTEIIRVYGDVLDTASWVDATSRVRTAMSKVQ